jgi:hypothetical protein
MSITYLAKHYKRVWNKNISLLKSKVMAFKGQGPVRSKTVVGNILGQVNMFTYLLHSAGYYLKS